MEYIKCALPVTSVWVNANVSDAGIAIFWELQKISDYTWNTGIELHWLTKAQTKTKNQNERTVGRELLKRIENFLSQGEQQCLEVMKLLGKSRKEFLVELRWWLVKVKLHMNTRVFGTMSSSLLYVAKLENEKTWRKRRLILFLIRQLSSTTAVELQLAPFKYDWQICSIS